MKRFLLLVVIGVMLGSCKKDDGGTTPPPPDTEFPASTKFAATLYAPTTTVSNGASFEIRFVLYNVSQAFGAAAEITFSNDKVQIDSSSIGSAFGPSGAIISLRGPVNANTYAYGVSYRAGSGSSLTGSGVIVKLKCHAIATGTATFSITPSKLEIKRADGTPINNFGTILIEPATVTIN
ncbi:MAG: hypothetical protein HY961_11620 [Ignavibacteriae bacterium]|nr:hypothetical protein [Ignavibacteriota bacterium]